MKALIPCQLCGSLYLRARGPACPAACAECGLVPVAGMRGWVLLFSVMERAASNLYSRRFDQRPNPFRR